MNPSQKLRVLSLTFHLSLIFGQEFRQKKYNILNGLKISQSYRILDNIATITTCALQCLNDDLCVCANYNEAANQCELTQHSPEDDSLDIVEDTNWNIIHQAWNLIFRGTAGIGIPTYSAYMGTESLPTPSNACKLSQTTNCTTHYRVSDVIDSWKSHNIKQVKFVLYKAGMAVVNITFSNSGSDDKTSWFSADHIISSSYVDMTPTAIYNYFSLIGTGQRRRFYINYAWGGCPFDQGWICVFDLDPAVSGEFCAFAHGHTYPYYGYLPNNNKGVFATDVQGADVMAIYTKN